MIKKPLLIAHGFLISSLLFSGCKGDTGQPESGGTTPSSEEYAELVSTCSDWKTGGGKETTGGSNSTSIFHVTSLADDDAYQLTSGTFRYAMLQSGPRIIVFDVAGTIHLKAPITLEGTSAGDLTVLGQSAPGQGICIADYPIIIKNTQNIILRFIRCRLGNESLKKDANTDYDALSVNDSRNILIDHCSFSWSVDECVSCYGNENFTLQYCFVTESLRDAGHVKGTHGYGGIWGGKNASFHHNLLAHHDSRNPRFDHDYVDNKHAGPIDFVNNVIYNWGGNSTYGGEGSTNGAGGRHINMVNNYYKDGPSTNSKVRTRIVNPWTSCDNCIDACHGEVVPPIIYLTGNYMYSSAEISENNWKGSTASKDVAGTDARWKDGMTLLSSEQTAEEAYETVLAKAGCSLFRDDVDTRIVKEVQNGGGKLIDQPADVGGWPELKGEKDIADADGDGISDEWETKYGMNPNDRKDARLQTLVSGYTNLEVYLCDKVTNLY